MNNKIKTKASLSQLADKNIKGFTLLELLIVIAIIGILTGVIMVSMKGAVEKSKQSSALTSVSSVLPEFVTCQDDIGTIIRPNNVNIGGGVICNASGHSATWPNIAKTGWIYNGISNIPNQNIANSSFKITKSVDGIVKTITCVFSTNECTVPD